jgi:SAM-dependent methyltransferase
MLPKTLEGMRILDLGCGFGDFARKARREGACAVVGIDISLRMLERAIALTDDPAIEYRTPVLNNSDSIMPPLMRSCHRSPCIMLKITLERLGE